jgi:hypothetical protein
VLVTHRHAGHCDRSVFAVPRPARVPTQDPMTIPLTRGCVMAATGSGDHGRVVRCPAGSPQAMQMRMLGRLWPVSALTLGGGGLGQLWGATTREEAVVTVREAVDSGVTLLDLAPRYGDGEAERVIGEAFGGRLPAGVRVTPSTGSAIRRPGRCPGGWSVRWGEPGADAAGGC